MASLDRKDVRNTYIIITSIITFLIIFKTTLWLLGKDVSSSEVLAATIFLIPVVILWTFYYFQKGIDKSPTSKKRTPEKIYEVGIKVSGIVDMLRSASVFIVSPIMIIMGISTLLKGGVPFEISQTYRILISILLILIGVAYFFLAKFLWGWGSIKSKGRLYRQEHTPQ